MSPAVLNIAFSYFRYSRFELWLHVLAYAAMLTVVFTGWPLTLLDEPDQLAAVVQEPFFLMAFPALVSSMVGWRLTATRCYSLGFLAPRYRRLHLLVGGAMVLLLGWLPVLAGNPDEAVASCALLCALTGVILLSRDHPLPLLPFVVFVLAMALSITLALNQLVPRWYVPWPLGLLLSIIGACMLFRYGSDYLAGHEYGDIAPASPLSPITPRDYWVTTAGGIATPARGADKALMLLDGRTRGLSRMISKFGRSAKDDRAIGALISYAAGEREALRVSSYVLVVLAVLAPISLLAFDDPTLILLLLWLAGAAVVITAAGTSLSPAWDCGTVWFRCPGATKASTLYMMTRSRAAGIVAMTGVFACLVVALTEVIDYRAAARPTYGTEVMVLLPLRSSLFAIVGCTCQAIAFGLMFSRLGRANAHVLGSVCLLIWCYAIVALQPQSCTASSFFVCVFPVSVTMFVSGLVSLTAVVPWWYSGFYRRLDFNL